MKWDAARIEQLLQGLRAHRGDTTLIEVKRAAGGLPESAAETVCAFANMPDGGTLILGIDERNDFAITGVADPAAMEAGLVSQARNSVSPVPHIRTDTVTVLGKQVVVAEVRALRLVDRPAMLGDSAYLRQADGDYVMHEHELAMIEVEKILLTAQKEYDSTPVPGSSTDDLVPEIVENFLRNARARDKRLNARNDAEILRRTQVLTANGEVTIAGLYAMGDYPQGAFPSLTVTAAVQTRSDTGSPRNRDLQHFTGPIPVLLDELMAWCERNIPLTRAYRPDGHMIERPEIPLSAMRELLSNALVHRDLSPNTLGTGKSVQVRLTPNFMLVQSPGGLRGVSLRQLESEEHAQAAVNQRLYMLAQKLETADGSPIIEGEGGGIHEVFRAATEYGLRHPSLTNSGVQFIARVWRPEDQRSSAAAAPSVDHQTTDQPTPIDPASNPGARLSKNAPALFRAFAQIDSPTFEELLEQTDLTQGQLRYALHTAIDAGVVTMHGGQGRPSTYYTLSSANPEQ